MNRFNILPIIAIWREFEETERIRLGIVHNFKATRRELIDWIGKAGFYNAEADLIADCMIAAGCGYESEQIATVYCSCSQS